MEDEIIHQGPAPNGFVYLDEYGVKEGDIVRVSNGILTITRPATEDKPK